MDICNSVNNKKKKKMLEILNLNSRTSSLKKTNSKR